MTVPPLPSPHIGRPALVKRLAGSRFTCITAPAGYGKTTLLAEACRQASHPWSWLTLTAQDRDPAILVSDLTAVLGAPPAAGPPVPALALSDLARRLQRQAGEATLVLDDVHALLGAEESCQLLNQFLSEAPGGLAFMMAGRELPPLPALLRQRLLGNVRDLGPADLALSPGESKRLLAALGRPDGADLEASCQGWPAALRLLAAAAPQSAPAYGDLFDYLAAEVLSGLEPERRRFLVEAAVLPVWPAAACDWILVRHDSQHQLEGLARVRLLVNAEPDGSLRPHPLWREFLARRLRAEPARWKVLQQRAARWELDHGRPESGLEHALAAEDWGLAELALRQVVTRCVQAGHLQRLEEWLEAVPPLVLEQIPEQLLAAGEALRRAGRPRSAVKWLQAAVSGGCALLTGLSRLALAHGDLGHWEEAQAALRQVADEAEQAAGAERAEALLALAEAAAAGGDAAAAADRYREAEAIFRTQGLKERAGAALAGLGAHALVGLGRPEEALQTLARAQALLGGAASCDSLLAEAQISADLGRWEAAVALLQGARPASAPQQARLHWLGAQVAARRGDLAEAGRLCQLGDLCLTNLEHTPALDAAALLPRGWLDHAGGNHAQALAAARRVQQLAVLAGDPILQMAAKSLLRACSPEAEAPGAPPLRVRCLGPFLATQGEAELSPRLWGRAQARGVFQFLLLHPGLAVSREAVMEAFWPDEPAERSRGALRTILYQLRRALQEVGWELQTTTDMVAIPPGAIAHLDIVEFHTHLAAARNAAERDPEGCLAHCRAAHALWRGDLLAGEYWTWVDPLRQKVRREQIELLCLWRRAAQRQGYSDEAVTALEELLELEPGYEAALRDLLVLLAGTGRTAEALQRYRRWVRWLKAEMGADPEPETHALLRQLLR